MAALETGVTQQQAGKTLMVGVIQQQVGRIPMAGVIQQQVGRIPVVVIGAIQQQAGKIPVVGPTVLAVVSDYPHTPPQIALRWSIKT